MDSVAKCYEALSEYCKALAEAGSDPQKVRDWEVLEINRISRIAKEKQALEKLHLGPSVAAELGKCHFTTMYRRAKRRAKKLAKFQNNANVS